MTVVAKSRQIVAKSRFRVEIDNIGDLRLTSASALKISYQFLTTEEGGRGTVAEHTINTHSFEPLTVERPLSEDTKLGDWAESLRLGHQDKRNGYIYAVSSEGIDLYRWTLEECFLVEYTDFTGDGKAKEEAMMETAVIRYISRGQRETL